LILEQEFDNNSSDIFIYETSMTDKPDTNNSLTTDNRVDAITGSIIRGALENIAIEMGHKLMRMSYSSIIRESEDFGAALCDAEGRQLCECTKSTPLQSGPIPGYVKGIIKTLTERNETINPGDVIIHNDPYAGASHSPDIGFCVPVFYEDKLIGFSVTTAHHLDIGSSQPGSVGVVKCADIYAEGLQFKALKAFDKGQRNNTLWQLIRDNVRVSDLVVGDMEAQIAACHIGAQRLLDLVAQYGLETTQNAVEDLFDYSERLMRSQIQLIADGSYTATGYVDGFLGEADPELKDLPIVITVTVADSDMTVDFAGTNKQLEGYAINMPFIGTVDVSVWLTLRSILLDTEVFGNIPQNDGLYRPITITAPIGCLANPIFPTPTIARFAPGNIVADTLMKALSPALPEQVCAGIANLKAITFAGMRDNQHWMHIEIFEGSYGGRFGKDGMDSVDTLYANTRNNPIEDIESHVPLRVTRYEFRDDETAPGTWRGGTNAIKEVEFLSDGNISVEGDGHSHSAWGFQGGKDGATSKLLLEKLNGEKVELPSMLTTINLLAGEKIQSIGGMGGGYGDPLQRDAETVLGDVLDELITREQAREHYGVVITEQKAIDADATQALRKS
jgi:N-methylhydantoinase B